MSNGSGHIIIRSLIATPGVTQAEIEVLTEIESRYKTTHKCTRNDVWKMFRIWWRLLR